MLAGVILAATPGSSRVGMTDIVAPPQTHPLAALAARVEIPKVQRARDGIEIKLSIENRGRTSLTLEEPIFSAFLAQADGTTFRNPDDAKRFSCAPEDRHVPQEVTIAPSKTWQSSLRIRQVLRAVERPTSPPAPSTDTSATMASPSYGSLAVDVPSGTYEVYTMLLIASASEDRATAPHRTLQAQIPGIEVTLN